MKRTLEYPVSLKDWMLTPVVRSQNPLTGAIEGDDSGYRSMTTLRENPSPLVSPVVRIRASYDGTDEFGVSRPEIALAGGLDGGKLVVRETAAAALELLDGLVRQASDRQWEIVALDGFRSGARQSAGFTRLLLEQMKLRDLSSDGVGNRIADFIAAGNIADGTFSWVNLIQDDKYRRVVKRLKGHRPTYEQLVDISARGNSTITEEAIDDTIFTYLTISANSGIGEGVGLSLNFENNAHAGGGACDVFVVEMNGGRPVNIVPFDYAGPEAGMDFMELEGSHEAYLRAAAEKPELKRHLERLGYNKPDVFRALDWSYFRSAIRVLYHASRAIGCTYYSGEVGGENWHLEPGNRVFDPTTGSVFACETLTLRQFPDSGNPGHTLQTLGREAIAVWGGHSAHEIARRSFGLA